MFQHQEHQQDKDQDGQANDTPHGSRRLLVSFGLFQLLNTRLGMFDDGFHIVIDTIQNGLWVVRICVRVGRVRYVQRASVCPAF